MANREYGRIKFFDGTKGFGFIVSEVQSTDGDVFISARSAKKEGSRLKLTPGTRVSFIRVPTARGPQASDVLVADDGPQHTKRDARDEDYTSNFGSRW